MRKSSFSWFFNTVATLSSETPKSDTWETISGGRLFRESTIRSRLAYVLLILRCHQRTNISRLFLSASKFKLKGLLNTINVKSQPKKSVLPLRALLIKSIIIPLWDNSREVWSHWQDFGYCFLIYFTYVCLKRQFWQRQTSIGNKQEKISRCWSYLVENEKY